MFSPVDPGLGTTMVDTKNLHDPTICLGSYGTNIPRVMQDILYQVVA